MRAVLRRVVVAAASGALTVAAAWAGTGLVPVSPSDAPQPPELAVPTEEPTEPDDGGGTAADGTTSTTDLLAPGSVAIPSVALDPGWYLVGAAKVDVAPRPDPEAGETWVTDRAACETGDPDKALQGLDHVAAAGSPWLENPDCIYMGGFGLGPQNAVESFDTEFGLWVRTLAVSDGVDGTLFLTVLDGEGWFWDYASKCDDCGWKQIGARLAGELGVDESAFIFHTTHSHAAPDFIGGWGFVPDWYMRQVTESIEESIRRSVATMEPARIEVGEVLARPFNTERRGTYRAAEEQELAWLRAYVPGRGRSANHAARTVATVGAYAAHPTTTGTNGGVAHPDWPGLFEAEVERRFGGVGLHFMTGLGNMKASGGAQIGTRLGGLVPELGEGATLETTDVVTARRTWNQPTTNAPLTALGVAGFFDREFQNVPAAIRAGENTGLDEGAEDLAYEDRGDEGFDEDDAPFVEVAGSPCVSASPTSVELPASAARIGELLTVTAAPGEVFSNLTNAIKEEGLQVTMPIGQANDALGYMPQSFERATNEGSGQGGGFVFDGHLHFEYEDAYSVDRCIGDAVLEATIGLLADVLAR